MNSIKMSKTKEVKTPTRGTPGSAGIDFYVPDGFIASVAPGEDVCIPSGVKANVPKGYAFIAHNKSGVALKKKLAVGACVVDEDYQGEIHLHLFNQSNEYVQVESGEKLIQFLLVPVIYPEVKIVDEKNLFESSTIRGEGAFGSTGDF